MDIFKHSLCDSVLGVSEKQRANGVEELPILAGHINGVPIVQSFWKPNAEEIAALSDGHPIVLTVVGVTHAPVSVAVCAVKE